MLRQIAGNAIITADTKMDRRGLESARSRPKEIRPLTAEVYPIKVCCTCKTSKPLEEFHRDKGRKDGHTTRCKECVREYQRANASRMEENRQRRIAEDPEEFKRQRRAVNLRYRHNNLEQARLWSLEWARRNREKMQENTRRWRERNPEKARVSNLRRRALEMAAEGAHTAAELRAMYEDQEGLCAYCEAPLFGSYHVDHMVPLSRGGRNDWTNLALACVPCNQAKYAKTAEEFWAVIAA